MNTLYWGVEYIASFVEMLFGFIFCGTFTDRAKINDSKPRLFFFSALGALIIILINSIELFSHIATIIGVLTLISAQFIVYHKHPVKTLIFALIYFTILILIDFVVVYLTGYVSEIPIGSIALEHSEIRLLSITLSKSVLAVTVYGVYKITVGHSALPKRYLVALSSFSVFFCVLSLVIVFKDAHANIETLTIVSALFFVMALALMLILFFGTIKISEYYENIKQMALLEMKNDMLHKAMTETEKTFSLWKTSLHDYKHNIFHLMTLAEKGDIAEIKSYLEKENGLLSDKLFYYKTGNDTVDALLNVKQTIAREHGIAFMINAAIPEKVKISDNHLCVILGNLIDNAINASINILIENGRSRSERISEPFIEVSIKQMKDFLVIKVINQYMQNVSQRPVKLNYAHHLHGIGLKSVKSIVSEYRGEFSVTNENDLFTAKVIIGIK